MERGDGDLSEGQDGQLERLTCGVDSSPIPTSRAKVELSDEELSRMRIPWRDDLLVEAWDLTDGGRK